MKTFIGNIVCTKNCVKTDIFNVVSEINKIDRRFPTLIIGWENAKQLYDDISIIDWKINDDIYWTHYKNVKKSRYDNDLNEFKEICLKRLGEGVRYNPLDFFMMPEREIKYLFEETKREEYKYCYITDKQIYIYPVGSNVVYGISKYELDYLGISVYTLIEPMKNMKYTKFIYHDYDIPFSIKDSISGKKYMVPYLTALFNSIV